MAIKRLPEWAPAVILLIMVLAVILFSFSAFAAIPLITDDTGTQGKGRFQLELFGEYGHDRDERITAKTSDLSATVTYGIVDPLDLILSVPYQSWRNEHSEGVTTGDGISDISIDAKWRFFEREGLSFAIKPGFTIPTGDEAKGLGTGKVTYHLFFIASREISPWAFHINLGYTRNENKIDERTDLWQASIAATVDVAQGLKLAGDMGVETNVEKSSRTPLAYILGGLIWSPRENLDIGLGVKGGLTKPETDISLRGGITWRF